MNNKLLNLIGSVLAAAFVFSCSKYDDTPIREQLSDHEQRIASLEEQCRHLQQDLSSLKQIVEALEKADYVTSVVPVTMGDATVGYTLTFKNSAPITIYNGKDGHTPQISIDKDEDGLWYWTLDGEWLLDASGKKVKAVGVDGKDGKDGKDGADGNDGQSGEDGKDGVTPLIKIIDEYWYLSVDNGTTWTKLDKATGDKGESGDSFFQSVADTGEAVVLTLSDGKVITLQKYQPLNISFDYDSFPGLVGTERIPYEITGNADSYEIASLTTSSKVVVSIEQTDAKHGYLVLTSQIPTSAQVAVFVTAADGQSTVRVLSFESGGLRAVRQSITVDDASQVIEVALSTNLISYDVYIPHDAQSWIEEVPATKGWRDETVYLKVEENTGVSQRSTTIFFVKDEFTVYSLPVTQLGVVLSASIEDFYNYYSGERCRVTATIIFLSATQIEITGGEHELILKRSAGTNYDDWISKLQLGRTITFVGSRNSRGSLYVDNYTIESIGDVTTYNTGTIAEAKFSPKDSLLSLDNVLVVGKSSALYLVQDSAGDYMTVYGGSSSVNVGDRINLTATRSSYGGFAELINPSETVISSGNSVIVPVAEDVTASFDTYTWTVGKHVIFRGTLAITGQYNYSIVNVEGATKYTGFLLLPPMTDAELTEFKTHSGEYITVSGYYLHYSGSRYQNILVTNYEF